MTQLEMNHILLVYKNNEWEKNSCHIRCLCHQWPLTRLLSSAFLSPCSVMKQFFYFKSITLRANCCKTRCLWYSRGIKSGSKQHPVQWQTDQGCEGLLFQPIASFCSTSDQYTFHLQEQDTAKPTYWWPNYFYDLAFTHGHFDIEMYIVFLSHVIKCFIDCNQTQLIQWRPLQYLFTPGVTKQCSSPSGVGYRSGRPLHAGNALLEEIILNSAVWII